MKFAVSRDEKSILPHPLSPCIFFIILFFSLMIIAGCRCGLSPHTGRCFYVRTGGNDGRSGLSPEQAWRTIGRVNREDFEPGDRILFEGGSRFEGTIVLGPGDSGIEGKRITLSSFGGKAACVDGGDAGALLADSCDHLTVEKLSFRGNGRKGGNTAEGVFISRSRFVKIDSVEVSGFQHSGLRLHICDDAGITQVHAHDNGFAGIHVTGTTVWDTARYDNHRLYVGYCIAENNPGDPSVTDNHSGSGILASSVEGGIIEYCEAFGNGWDMPWNGNGPVGIWIWDSRDFIIQYCVSHDNRSAPDAADGGGFDFDGGVSRSILQYCLSYGNQGPGIGLFEFGAGKPWHDNTVRYNISLDDGKNGQGSVAIWRGEAGGSIRNCEIYNNTFYNSNPDGPSLCVMNNWEGFHFRNNVFVFNGPFLMRGKKLKNEKFENNCYWNLAGSTEFLDYPDMQAWAGATGNEIRNGKIAGLYADPGLQKPGNIPLISPLLLSGGFHYRYMPAADSPLIDAGLDMKKSFGIDPGSRDIAGNPVPQGRAFDIGAVERVPSGKP